MKIFSGIRPSGKLHLGNYLGAIKNWIDLQNRIDTEQAIFAVVDYHGITTPFDQKTYRAQIMDTALDYLAAGIDPKKSLLIRQSRVPAHAELAWIFGTITPLSWLDRLPTYLEKKEQATGRWKNNTGILTYPVLMAADILIYKSDTVPVGDDQKAHIDLANEIAKKFNSMFGETFPRVQALKTEGERILSLQDPAKKMSKTGGEGIALSDDPDTVADKIKRAVTDSSHEIVFDTKNKPAISNLMTIARALTDMANDELERKYKGVSYSSFKEDLALIVIDFLKQFQARRKELSRDSGGIEQILIESEEKANTLANSTLNEIKRNMGIS